jgi:hypothetical protein
MAVNKWCNTCQREETTIVKDTKIRIIDCEKVPIDEKKLLKDLEERVIRFKGKGLW